MNGKIGTLSEAEIREEIARQVAVSRATHEPYERTHEERINYSIHVPNTFAEMHPAHLENLSKHQLIYSIAGLVLGIICVVGGVVLFLNGIAGSTSWTAKLLGAESTVSDAAPGAVLFIVGLFVVFITRYVLRVKK